MPTGKRSAEDHRVLAFKIHRTGGNISAFSLLRFGTGKERFFGRWTFAASSGCIRKAVWVSLCRVYVGTGAGEAGVCPAITKRLYSQTAQYFHTTTNCVERNLRTLVQACWRQPNHSLLERIAGHPLSQPPTNAQFIDMVAAFLRK